VGGRQDNMRGTKGRTCKWLFRKEMFWTWMVAPGRGSTGVWAPVTLQQRERGLPSPLQMNSEVNLTSNSGFVKEK